MGQSNVNDHIRAKLTKFGELMEVLEERNRIERAKLAEMRAARFSESSRWCDDREREASTTHALADKAWWSADRLTAEALGEGVGVKQ